MTKDKALKQALEALEIEQAIYCGNREDGTPEYILEAITAIKEALAQPEPDACKHEWFRTGAMEPRECRCIKCGAWNTTPPQRTWVGLMRGVRVEGDTVVITVKGGNDAARELCGDLIKEMNK